MFKIFFPVRLMLGFDNADFVYVTDYTTDATPGSASSMLLVVGHRGCGKNKILPAGVTSEARQSIRENTVTSFNLAARNGAQFVEFDVQVTKDGVPVIFHDDVIITEDHVPRRIGELTLDEFRAIGPQSDPTKVHQLPTFSLLLSLSFCGQTRAFGTKG